MTLEKEWILYEDGDILVLHKPSGIAVQNARSSQMDLEHMVLNELAKRTGGGRKIPYLGVINRLDQPVEGILVFAKTPAAAAELNRQLQSGKMDKRYLAVTEGIPHPAEGTLVNYLKKQARTNLSCVTDQTDRDAKRAELSYCVINSVENQALVEIHLKTGRHHQIRVQMAHLGTPLAGDRKYGAVQEDVQLSLCANKLRFEHPRTHKKMEFSVFPSNPHFKNLAV